jgi:hypothetical protein
VLSGRGHDGVGIRGRGRVGVGGDDASRLSGLFAVVSIFQTRPR